MPGASTRNRLTTDGYRPPPKSWEEIFREQQEQQNSVSRNSSNRSVKLSNELMRERHLTSLNSIRKKNTAVVTPLNKPKNERNARNNVDKANNPDSNIFYLNIADSRASVNQSDKYSTSSNENSKQSSGGSSDPSSSYKNVNGSFYGNEKQVGGGNNFSSSSAADHVDKSPGCCSLCCRACCRCGRYGTYCTRCTWILFFLGLLIGALAIGGLIAAALTSQLSDAQAGLDEAAEILKGCFLQPMDCESNGGCDYNANKTAINCKCDQGNATTFGEWYCALDLGNSTVTG